MVTHKLLLPDSSKLEAQSAQLTYGKMLRTYSKRAKLHREKVEADEYVPFYIGKNMSVRGRVARHLTGKADFGTYRLKLLYRGALLRGCTLRAGGVVFEVDAKAYFRMQFLEAALCERLRPIVGKQ
jgi:hypothetical protein